MESSKDKKEKVEEDERKKEEFSKTWIGRRKWLHQNQKEKEEFLKYSQML